MQGRAAGACRLASFTVTKLNLNLGHRLVLRSTMTRSAIGSAAALTGLGLPLLLLLGGCSGNRPDDFTLKQAPPQILSVDIAPPGLSKGDLTFFEARLSRDGKNAGHVLGELTTIGLPGDSGRSDAEKVNRTELSFRLPEGLILAAGFTEVAPQDWKIKARQPSQRVILGGTGRYAGVRGVLSTVRLEDSSFEHQFQFRD